MPEIQLNLPFENAFGVDENPRLWSPRKIWSRLDQAAMEHFSEDRRVDYKRAERINYQEYANWLSMFSNTVDGGVIVFGATSKGDATGCSQLTDDAINKLERHHIQSCPLAKPEFRRVRVMVDGKEDFCLAVYVPHIGKLVETNKGEAFIRYGDSKHKMDEIEKADFRSTHHEKAFEQQKCDLVYPEDFDAEIIEDFCRHYRDQPGRGAFSNEECLIDAELAECQGTTFTPRIGLALLAGLRIKGILPGARVRIQRFRHQTEGSGESYNPARDIVIEGCIPRQIERSITAIEGMLEDVTWLNREGKFVTMKEYPRYAWLEAITNACVHRSYSYSGTEIFVKFFPDRLVVESPGSFVPPVSEETIYSTRAARNHHTMEALRYLGFVRMAREGARRIRDSMIDVDLPEPTFTQNEQHGVAVWVVLYNDAINRKRSTNRDVADFLGAEVWSSLQDYEIDIVGFAFKNPKVQIADAQRLTGVTWHTARKYLQKMARKGILFYQEPRYPRDNDAHFRLAKRDNDDG